MKIKAIGIMMFAFVLCGILAMPADAAVPKLLTYQGVLKDGSGNFLTGTYSMTFRIYSASTGGTALWTETQSSVSASSGKFSVTLGSVTTLSLDFNSDYWLSTQVGSDAEMSPRVRLTSMAYGIRADYENNGFTQAAHDALSHMNIEGVQDNAVHIAKTNFKLDAYTLAAANSMGDLIVDTLNDATGINAGASSSYAHRGTPNYDVTVATTGGGVLEQNTSENVDNTILGSDTTTYNGMGNAFQVSSQKTVDKAAFKIKKVGSPSGNVRIRLYSSSASLPGTLLAESANISVASLGTTYAEVSATFSAVTLSASTEYFIVLENIDGSGDGSNYVNIRYVNSNAYSGGPVTYKNTSGTWATASGGDVFFKVYEQLVYNSPGTVVSNAYSEPAAPTEAMVIVDETLGTGSITYHVSRDNGTTWTQCTKETVTSISAQPSGTQIKWKAVITGNAELNAIAVAI